MAINNATEAAESSATVLRSHIGVLFHGVEGVYASRIVEWILCNDVSLLIFVFISSSHIGVDIHHFYFVCCCFSLQGLSLKQK